MRNRNLLKGQERETGIEPATSRRIELLKDGKIEHRAQTHTSEPPNVLLNICTASGYELIIPT
jgi:hypothetical protein